MAILYEDRDVIAIDKPAGLLTMGTERNKTRTAYFALTDYVRKGQPKSRNRVFIVHRLDRETSGVVLFAKSPEAKLRLQANWSKTRKIYLAVVHGHCRRQAETITTHLAENAAHRMYSTPDKGQGRLARTAYRVLRQGANHALLEIDLLTGRKHQIRVHLAGIGHPVVGDDKYGRGDGHKRLALHARSISFEHPTDGRAVTVEARTPGFFDQLMGR